jgi:hypothetical protein
MARAWSNAREANKVGTTRSSGVGKGASYRGAMSITFEAISNLTLPCAWGSVRRIIVAGRVR